MSGEETAHGRAMRDTGCHGTACGSLPSEEKKERSVGNGTLVPEF